jgi:hypothetical protein
MRRFLVVVFSSACLVAPAFAEPPKPMGSTDAERCGWEWKAGGGIGVWAERCDLDTGLWQLRYDEALPGFALTVDGGDVAVVLQTFAKPAEAPVSAILPDLRRRGYIPDDEECVFAPAAIRPAARTIAFFDIQPTGARKAAFEATPVDEVPEPPCGDYGWSTHGIRYFMTDTRFPDRVIYVDIGEDGMMFDPETVTLE